MIHSNSWPHLQCHLSENKYTTFWLFFFSFSSRHIHVHTTHLHFSARTQFKFQTQPTQYNFNRFWIWFTIQGRCWRFCGSRPIQYLLKIYCDKIPRTNWSCIIEWHSDFWWIGTISFMYNGIRKWSMPMASPPMARPIRRIQ